MTLIDKPKDARAAQPREGQHFVFPEADWALYEQIGQRLADRRVFVTFYKGRLEIVTISFLHERIVGLLITIVRVLAEETDTPLAGAGMATLRRRELDEGVQADASFYIANEATMRGSKQIDLDTDPPPDLAIEVEVTSRLGARKTIYQDLG
ncbi:MAG: Uma2 family endonuclease, partial [Tepidisphaeraceae bacterium]